MLGMMVRSDNGGLGAMTSEIWRHVHPAKTLIVHGDHRTRGRAHNDRYDGGPGEVRVTPRTPTHHDLRWLLDGVDTVYSAETWYSAALSQLARRARVRTVLHVMPEYYQGAPADLLLAPTTWRTPGGSTFLPVPVARDRLPRREPRPVRTLFHIESPEADRNGTDLLLDAIELVTEPCQLWIRTHGEDRVERRGRTEVHWLHHHDGPYYEAWPAEVDALVMPRRFAGLSLPMQEAAALGLPVIVLDRTPESEWFPLTVSVLGWEQRRIFGRNFVDWAVARPTDLAVAINLLVRGDLDQCDWRGASERLADYLDWAAWVDRYRELLGA